MQIAGKSWADDAAVGAFVRQLEEILDPQAMGRGVTLRQGHAGTAILPR